MEVTKTDFLEWKSGVVTQEVFKILEDRINSLEEALGNGVALHDQERYADHVGRIQAYRDMLEIDFEG